MTTAIANACRGCGIPLDDQGDVDWARIDAWEQLATRVRSLAEERAILARRIAAARSRVETARQYGDEDDAAAGERQLVRAERHLGDVEAALAAHPDVPDPPERDCEACGVRFRGGRIDRRLLGATQAERAKAAGWLRALEEEREALQRRIAIDRAQLEQGAGLGRDATALHRGSLERATQRLPAVETAIAEASTRQEALRGRKTRGAIRAFVAGQRDRAGAETRTG